jgi:hypothetical protein
MSAYVDDLQEWGGCYHGDGAAQAARVGAENENLWCHLYADTEEELHAFARRIGMRRRWAQVSRRGIPHYDLTPGRRGHALILGAVPLTRREAFHLRQRLRDPGTSQRAGRNADAAESVPAIAPAKSEASSSVASLAFVVEMP